MVNFFIVFNHEKAMTIKLVVNFFIVFNHEKAFNFGSHTIQNHMIFI